jgi:dipeptidyl aminopeptidase/acylaminoacyl peptidase
MEKQSKRRRLAARDLWEMTRVGTPVPALADSVIVPATTYDIDDNKGTTRLYAVPRKGGDPRPLTAPDRSASQPAVSPDRRFLAFVRKPTEDGKDQVHVMALDGGEARCVTYLPLGAADPRWLPDGRRLVCLAPVLRDAPTVEGTKQLLETRKQEKVTARVTEDRCYRFWDSWLTEGEVPHLFLVDVETGDVRDLTPDSERWFDFMDKTGHFDIDPDGQEIAFAANSSSPPYTSHLRWAIYTVPVGGGPVTCVTPDNAADDMRPRYSPCGRYILYGAQREIDFYADRVRLVRHDRATGEDVWLTEEWDASASAWEFSPDGATVLFVAEDRGRVNLYRLPLAGGTPELVCQGGSISGPRPAADGYVYFQYQTLSRPPEVARCPQTGGDAEILTHWNDAQLAELELGEVVERDIAGAGGAPVQMFVVRPPGFDPARRWPLVHLIHGGPHGTFGDQFHFRWNAHAFAAAGYVVALVNFHGSTSFGQSFATSIHGAWGDKPLADIMAATDALLAEGSIDEARMAVAGGSYGGYMTAWITSQNARFACAVCHAGVINLPGMYATDHNYHLDRAQGGLPWRNREAIERWSPAAFAHGFATPMLVIHGEKDYRVPVTQGIELYGILKSKGVDARLVYYPDENHWILKPQNSLHWYGEVLGWLERHLGAKSGARKEAAVAEARA